MAGLAAASKPAHASKASGARSEKRLEQQGIEREESMNTSLCARVERREGWRSKREITNANVQPGWTLASIFEEVSEKPVGAPLILVYHGLYEAKIQPRGRGGTAH